MARERTPQPRTTRDEQKRAAQVSSGDGALPSQRVAIPPSPGSDEAAFLDNLNMVYGGEAPADKLLVKGIRRYMRTVLADRL